MVGSAWRIRFFYGCPNGLGLALTGSFMLGSILNLDSLIIIYLYGQSLGNIYWGLGQIEWTRPNVANL